MELQSQTMNEGKILKRDEIFSGLSFSMAVYIVSRANPEADALDRLEMQK